MDVITTDRDTQMYATAIEKVTQMDVIATGKVT